MNIPLSCYIHIPWCLKKCPYCDFNSHQISDHSPLAEDQYILALCKEIDYWATVETRTINTIFIGGGTPSLFSDTAIGTIIDYLNCKFTIANNAEITIEANPATIETKFIAGYKIVGVNRVSLGVQSFNNKFLKLLGRIHNQIEILEAIENINKYFTNYNLDIMYGLPQQTLADVEQDLKFAIAANPSHLSCYNLTIEPNTYFAKYRPSQLPSSDDSADMQELINSYLNKQEFQQYEVAAYAKHNQYSKHNINYWLFGDYIGIGAGAASKISYNMPTTNGYIVRTMNIKHPQNYIKSLLTKNSHILTKDIVKNKDLIIEFMINALRLTDGFTVELFTNRTGLQYSDIADTINKHQAFNNLNLNKNSKESTKIFPTARGINLLNEILLDFN